MGSESNRERGITELLAAKLPDVVLAARGAQSETAAAMNSAAAPRRRCSTASPGN